MKPAQTFVYAPERRLDLYQPERLDAPAPLVIWSAGSGWLRDNGRGSARLIAQEFTGWGYAVAGVSVRSSAQATFPGQLHDIKAAIRWLRSHAGELHLDAGRFACMGDSSGGWVAVMAALTAGLPACEGEEGVTGVDSGVRAAVAFYPPTQFLVMDEQMTPEALASFNEAFGLTDGHNDPLSPESRLIGGPIGHHPDAVLAASPITYATRSDMPVLLVHGQADGLVPHDQSLLLYRALRANGATATFFSIPKVGHEWPGLLDPANQGEHTVYRTRSGDETVTTGAPALTWENVEQFVREAFSSIL